MKSEKVARLEKTRRELESARGPGDMAKLLNTRLAFTPEDLSVATGAYERTVRGWLEPEGQPPESYEHRRKLDQLKALVILILEDGTIAEDLMEWFRDPLRNLGYRAPLELIGDGRWKEVGSSLCEEIGIPKAVRPREFRPDPLSHHGA
jgi:hypothetical protein